MLRILNCFSVNVITHPDIQDFMKCYSSSGFDDQFECDNIYDDGLITESIGNDWASYREGPGAWIEVSSNN